MINMNSLIEKFRTKFQISTNVRFFLIFLAVRLFSVFLVQTWYVPDEYWQSLEVAHRLVFGYGYTTWEWVLGLRSYLHPLIIAFVYKILHILCIDTVNLLVLVPRVCQAVLSAYADLKFYHWSGSHKWAAFNIATSWFWFYTGSRTLINSFETSLTTIALSQFPWKGCEHKGNRFLWLVGLVCASRPTAALIWVPLCIYHIVMNRTDLKRTLLTYLITGSTIIAISIALDSLCHGEFVVTQWQFFKFNVFHDVGTWYGTQPWHWNLSIGLPTILGFHLVPFTLAIIECVRNRETYQNELVMLGSMVFTVVILSILPHKEFRFLLPVLPIALYVSSKWIVRWSYKANTLYLWIVAFFLLVSNVIPAVYLGLVHQRGTLDVMQPIAELAQGRPNDTSVLFLMPCHSTPLYSHIHSNITARILTCEPDLNGDSSGYIDEADQFYDNPNKWLHSEYPPNGNLPSHIVTFDTLVPMLSSILSRYKPVYRFGHTSVPLSSRIGYHVIVHQHVDY